MSEQVDDAPIDRGGYDFNAMQAKWRPVWEKLDPFKARDDGSGRAALRADMFPYPSGDLHMGHAEAFALGDVVARYWFQQGYDVLHPIGWDSFGLPAENAAIKRDEHPAQWTYANIETQAESFRRYAHQLRLVAPAAHLRPGVLPVDPVAVPAVLRARPGLPQGRLRQLVPATTRPCWPTSRSSRAGASAAAPR